MLFEVFKEVEEMTDEELTSEYVFVHEKHRAEKIWIRAINPIMEKEKLSPANVSGYLESLAKRMYYGARKRLLHEAMLRRPRKIKDLLTTEIKDRNLYREALVQARKAPMFEPSNCVVKPSPMKLWAYKLVNIPQGWEVPDLNSLLHLAGTAYIDFPKSWSGVGESTNPEVMVKGLHETFHVSIAPFLPWLGLEQLPTIPPNPVE